MNSKRRREVEKNDGRGEMEKQGGKGKGKGRKGKEKGWEGELIDVGARGD